MRNRAMERRKVVFWFLLHANLEHFLFLFLILLGGHRASTTEGLPLSPPPASGEETEEEDEDRLAATKASKSRPTSIASILAALC